MITCGLILQHEAQTTTRGILAVSAGAHEILFQFIWCFRSDHTLTSTLTITTVTVVLFSLTAIKTKPFVNELYSNENTKHNL